jgi:hypothetical protein
MYSSVGEENSVEPEKDWNKSKEDGIAQVELLVDSEDAAGKITKDVRMEAEVRWWRADPDLAVDLLLKEGRYSVEGPRRVGAVPRADARLGPRSDRSPNPFKTDGTMVLARGRIVVTRKDNKISVRYVVED